MCSRTHPCSIPCSIPERNSIVLRNVPFFSFFRIQFIRKYKIVIQNKNNTATTLNALPLATPVAAALLSLAKAAGLESVTEEQCISAVFVLAGYHGRRP